MKGHPHPISAWRLARKGYWDLYLGNDLAATVRPLPSVFTDRTRWAISVRGEPLATRPERLPEAMLLAETAARRHNRPS